MLTGNAGKREEKTDIEKQRQKHELQKSGEGRWEVAAQGGDEDNINFCCLHYYVILGPCASVILAKLVPGSVRTSQSNGTESQC
jgi:hypothetical protein